jgi:4-oxalocrotonate tautomerase
VPINFCYLLPHSAAVLQWPLYQPVQAQLPCLINQQGEHTMPYVNIRVAGTLSKEQKQKMAQGVTDAIVDATGKPKENILIFIDEESKENIAKAGILLEDM